MPAGLQTRKISMSVNSADIKANLRTAYDGDADRRDQGVKSDWKIAERAHFLDTIRNEDATNLLEIGAGTGHDSLFFFENGLTVTTTDLSPENVKHCQKKGLKAYVRDFYNLGFPSESFDAVWALNCLLHVPSGDLPQVLTNIKTILKPDGLFYYGVYGGVEEDGVYEDDRLEPKRWFTFYTDDDLKTVVSPFFILEYFNTIIIDDNELHFQSMILRNVS
jgi:SAM-dependent methyltransferase